MGQSAGMGMGKRAIFAVAWTEAYVKQAVASIRQWQDFFGDSVDFFLISDVLLENAEGIGSIVVDFKLIGYPRKVEGIVLHKPEGYEEYLYLDTDITILENIDFGFTQSKRFGIAVASAPTYLLDEFRGFDEVLNDLGIEPAGQIQYNSGLIFFTPGPLVNRAFGRWYQLCVKFQGRWNRDQEFLAVAMDLENLNPYVLSKAYNTRGLYEPIWGKTRVWHSHAPVPKGINQNYSDKVPRLLAKGKLRTLKRHETHTRAIRWWIKIHILNSIYRFLMPKSRWMNAVTR
jgi:hypothetical protein